MTKAKAKAELNRTIAELYFLNRGSERRHGAEFVHFSPVYRDYLSKRRVRLARTARALMKLQGAM